MNEPLSIGIIGAGVVSQWHAHAIEALPALARLAGVASRTRSKAEALAASTGCPVYEDWRAMIANDAIEAVCLCTPSGQHAEQAQAAMEAGKHVLVEKPMALTTAECLQLIETSRKTGRKLGVIYQLRTMEAALRLKSGIDQGVFGPLFFADASLKYWRDQAYYDASSSRGTWAADGGGATMIQGSHGIDLLLWMAGEVESIHAKMATVAHSIEVEDIAIALLTFKSGALGRLQASTATNPGQGNIIEVNGLLGTAILADATIRSWATTTDPGTLATETVEPEDFKAHGQASSATGFSMRGHEVQLENFVRAIREDKPLICPPEEGMLSVQLIEALYLSARRGETVELAELTRGSVASPR